MRTLRLASAVLPQLFLLMLVAWHLGWLGRFSTGDTGFGFLVGLFVLVPTNSAALLLVEAWRYLRRRGPRPRSPGHLLLALAWVVESLLINLYLLLAAGI